MCIWANGSNVYLLSQVFTVLSTDPVEGLLTPLVPSHLNLYGYTVSLGPKPHSIEVMASIHCTDEGPKSPKQLE